MFLHFSVPFTSNGTCEWQTVDCTTEHSLLVCILQLLYTVSTGARLICQTRYTQAQPPGSAQTEGEAGHMGNDVFRHSKEKKKNNLKINVCGELLFSSFTLTNDFTVQLLVGEVAAGREGDRAG